MGRSGSVLRKEFGSPNWVTGGVYDVDDVVIKDGYQIKCLVAHTAGTFATDLQNNYWKLTYQTKNILLNGNFDFWQRNTSFSAPAQNIYMSDRWANLSAANTSVTISRQSSGIAGSTYYLNWLAGSTSSRFNIGQALESTIVNTVKGKIITFSALLSVNAGNVRTYQLQIFKNATANTLAGGSWSQVATSTAVALTASVQTRISVSYTVPNDGTANGLRFQISDLATGLAADVVTVHQVMVNEGSAFGDFQMAGASVQDELQMCQRYYEKSYPVDTPPGTDQTGLENAFAITEAFSTTVLAPSANQYKMTKRISATVTVYSYIGTSGKISPYASGSNNTGTLTLSRGGQAGFATITSSSAEFTVGSFYWYAWAADAEL